MAWFVFGCGLLIVPVVFVVGCLTSHPPANCDSSFFGRHLAWPLFALGFCCCFASPFFTRVPLWKKFVLALAGALIAGLVFIVSVAVLFFIFPPMV